jgi:hypothetical protein
MSGTIVGDVKSNYLFNVPLAHNVDGAAHRRRRKLARRAPVLDVRSFQRDVYAASILWAARVAVDTKQLMCERCGAVEARFLRGLDDLNNAQRRSGGTSGWRSRQRRRCTKACGTCYCLAAVDVIDFVRSRT